MQFRYKKEFLKHFDRLSPNDKGLVIAADKEIRGYYSTHEALYGLRIKKLYAAGKDKVLEARVSDKLRVVWLESEGLVSFAILGSHDEVRNFLKNL